MFPKLTPKQAWKKKYGKMRKENKALLKAISFGVPAHLFENAWHDVPRPSSRSMIRSRIRARRSAGRGRIFMPVKLATPIGKLP
jgi:hypothetical protein